MSEARYRKVHCLIWNDDKFPFLQDDTQLVFFHLLTTPFSSPFGLYKASIGALADEKRWSRKRYEKAIADAIDHGMVHYDQDAYLIFIPNFLKYNKPTSPNQVIRWETLFNELPHSDLKIQWLKQLKAMSDSIADGMRDAINKTFSKAFGTASLIQEQEQEQCTGTGISTSTKKPESPPSGPPSKEEIEEGSLKKVKADLDKLTEQLYQEKIFKQVHSFKNKMLKEGKNERAILHVLARCYMKRPEDPWGYCVKIISVEDGNYNERDYLKDKN